MMNDKEQENYTDMLAAKADSNFSKFERRYIDLHRTMQNVCRDAYNDGFQDGFLKARESDD